MRLVQLSLQEFARALRLSGPRVPCQLRPSAWQCHLRSTVVWIWAYATLPLETPKIRCLVKVPVLRRGTQKAAPGESGGCVRPVVIHWEDHKAYSAVSSGKTHRQKLESLGTIWGREFYPCIWPTRSRDDDPLCILWDIPCSSRRSCLGAGACGVGCSSTPEGACVRDGWQQGLPVRNEVPSHVPTISPLRPISPVESAIPDVCTALNPSA